MRNPLELLLKLVYKPSAHKMLDLASVPTKSSDTHYKIVTGEDKQEPV